jgi:hypothetical protein
MARWPGAEFAYSGAMRSQWLECVRTLGSSKTRSGRPCRWKDEILLRCVLRVLGGGTRWAPRGGITPSNSAPSGAHCLRRLREWQRDGRWEAFIAVVRQQRNESEPVAAAVSEELIEKWCAAANRRNTAHRRRPRSQRPNLKSDQTNPLVSDSHFWQLREKAWWKTIDELVNLVRTRTAFRKESKDKSLVFLTTLAALARNTGWAWSPSDGQPGGRECLRFLRISKQPRFGSSIWHKSLNLIHRELRTESGDSHRIWLKEGLLNRIWTTANAVPSVPRKRNKRRIAAP